MSFSNRGKPILAIILYTCIKTGGRVSGENMILGNKINHPQELLVYEHWKEIYIYLKLPEWKKSLTISAITLWAIKGMLTGSISTPCLKYVKPMVSFSRLR